MRDVGRKVVLTLVVALLSANLFASSKWPGHPFPFVSSVTPQAVVPGSGAFTLNVYGANFNTSSVVNWNREPRQTTFVSARQLQAQILASDVAHATAGYITVTNTTPGGTLSTFASPSALVEVHSPTATISPGAPASYYLADPPLAVGDVTGKGVLDLSASTFSFGYEKMLTLMNQGDGTFVTGPVAAYDYFGQGDVEYGDVNGDGELDIVITEGNYKYSNSALQANLGNGDGTFTAGKVFGNFQGSPPSQFVLGDFNQDGALDVAVASPADDSNGRVSLVPIFSGNGDGTFELSNSAEVHLDPFAIVEGDFNGDGILDLVAESGPRVGFAEITLSAGIGNGTFQADQVITAINGTDSQFVPVCTGRTLYAADFNNDGKLDLAYCNESSIGIMLGNGDGTFQPTVFYKVGYEGAFTFAVGDFNSDGYTDLVVSHYPTNNYDHQFSVLLGNGNGTFGPKTVVLLQGSNVSVGPIGTGDFNSDGLLDFVLEPPSVPFVVYLQ
jgi:hypothetical protein